MGPFFLLGHAARSCPPGWCSGCGGRCCCASRSWASCGWPARLGIGTPLARLRRRARLRAGAARAHRAGRRSRSRPARGAGAVGAAAAGPRQPRRVAAAAAAWSGVAVLLRRRGQRGRHLARAAAAGALAADPCGAGRAARRAARWWVLAVALATPWWVVPLLLLGRYSPPFLDYIESARVTTLADAPGGDAARHRPLARLPRRRRRPGVAGGLDCWSPTPVARRGHRSLLAALGLAGLACAACRTGACWSSGCCTGVALVRSGTSVRVDGLLAGRCRTCSTGRSPPLRNVHKFDRSCALPLALGLAHLLGRRQRRGPAARPVDRRRLPRTVARGPGRRVAAPALIPAAGPARHVHGGARLLARDRRPGSHEQARARPRAARAGARASATYYWGDPRDEPLQALARSPWAVRDAIPLRRARAHPAARRGRAAARRRRGLCRARRATAPARRRLPRGPQRPRLRPSRAPSARSSCTRPSPARPGSRGWPRSAPPSAGAARRRGWSTSSSTGRTPPWRCSPSAGPGALVEAYPADAGGAGQRRPGGAARPGRPGVAGRPADGARRGTLPPGLTLPGPSSPTACAAAR